MRKIARLVVKGWPKVSAENAEACLFRGISNLTEPVDYLMTPGGFVFVKFLQFQNGNLFTPKPGWHSHQDELLPLWTNCELTLYKVISDRVIHAAKGRVKYLTLGFDVRHPGTKVHAELVALVDMSDGRIIRVTGKSYPTLDQEDSLYHVTNLYTHCYTTVDDRVLILGCHDLNVFNGRARANQKPGGPRHTRCSEMLGVFHSFNPTVILQHPHVTDTWKTWIQSWRAISREFPNAAWASAIAYTHPRKPREILENVLSKTHHEGDKALDVIVIGNDRPSKIQSQVVPNVPQLT